MKTKTAKGIDLSDILSPYRNQWVALSASEDKVVAHGNSLKKVVEDAEKKGESDPIVTKVPNDFKVFVL